MAWLNVAAWRDCTEAEGPGRRAALWVQGCDKRCPGCCNPGFLPLVERELIPVPAMLAKLLQAQQGHALEGLTLLGGEPMLQAQGLAELARGAQAAGLSVMVFTGYTLEELVTCSPLGYRNLLDVTDVLVDGPYERSQPDETRRWIGSRNQRLHYLSDRYDAAIERLPAGGRELEIRIGLDGALRVNGWPTRLVR
jgi:anaerobic ribonucleoside-triphosphate reductase activating protein